MTAKPKRRLRLWMAFAAVGLFAFVASLAGLVAVRVYDDQLVRQTESELIAQGAVVALAYRTELEKEVGEDAYGLTRTAAWPFPIPPGSDLRPLLPQLKSDDPVRPPAEDPRPSPVPPEARAARAGARLQPLLLEVRRSTLAGIRVVDPQGIIVSSSGLGTGGSLLFREEVQRALAGAPASVLRQRYGSGSEHPLSSLSRDTGARVTVALPVLRKGRVWGAVVLSRTPMTLSKAIYDDRWTLTATGLVLLLVVLLASALAAALIVRPVRALVKQTRAIAAGRPEGFTPVTRPVVQELAELSGALARTASALRDRNDYIRTFAANVSHEFKTPLSAIQGAVELLQDSAQAMTEEQRAAFLSNIEADAGRLTRLVQRLLELARADAMTAPPSKAALPEVLAQTVERARADGAKAALAPVPEEAVIPLPPEVVDAVVGQLIANARQHGGPDVTVTVAAEKAGEGWAVAVWDDGPGVSSANRAKVFDAFFTTSRERGGTGLGLTIARAMAHSFGGTLELVPGEAGARFELRPPPGYRK